MLNFLDISLRMATISRLKRSYSSVLSFTNWCNRFISSIFFFKDLISIALDQVNFA